MRHFNLRPLIKLILRFIFENSIFAEIVEFEINSTAYVLQRIGLEIGILIKIFFNLKQMSLKSYLPVILFLNDCPFKESGSCLKRLKVIPLEYVTPGNFYTYSALMPVDSLAYASPGS